MKTIFSILRSPWTIAILVFLGLCFLVYAPESQAKVDLGEKNVVGMWNFDEGKGEMAKDSSQYGNDGKVIDAKYVQGEFGTALQFTGKGESYVDVPDSKSLDFTGKSAISILLWIQMTGKGENWGRIVNKSPVNGSYTMCQADGELPTNILWRLVAGAWGDIFSSKLDGNKWYHVAGIYDGKESRLYLNGKVDQKLAYSGSLGTASKSLGIGGETAANGGVASWANAIIDEVVIIDRAVTEDEITDAMEGVTTAAVGSRGKLTVTWGSLKY
jgi:hypothetical protein